MPKPVTVVSSYYLKTKVPREMYVCLSLSYAKRDLPTYIHVVSLTKKKKKIEFKEATAVLNCLLCFLSKKAAQSRFCFLIGTCPVSLGPGDGVKGKKMEWARDRFHRKEKKRSWFGSRQRWEKNSRFVCERAMTMYESRINYSGLNRPPSALISKT